MKKFLIVLAVILSTAGVAVFLCAAAFCGFDFEKLNSEQYEMKNYSLTESFTSIDITSKDADVVFVFSKDETSVSYYESENVKYDILIENGILKICGKDERKWYEFITLPFGKRRRITLNLAATEYENVKINCSTGDVILPDVFSFENADITASTGDVNFKAKTTGDVKIATSTGDIDLQGVAAKSLDLKVSTGHVTLKSASATLAANVSFGTGKVAITDFTCKDLTIIGKTGDVTLQNTVCEENWKIRTSTGDVCFQSCDAADIEIKTSTGDVLGTLRSEKIFDANASTGKVEVPKTSSGGKCTVTTSTGDIKISIE